jgi:REP element-mobilizing transposase RayT
MGEFRKSSVSRREHFQGKHRFEHWYRDNSVYFVTARTEGGAHVFKTRGASDVFWASLDRYSKQYGLNLWVATLMSNHYHLLFYMRWSENLGPFMKGLHGSAAKLVNDLSETRLVPFWSWKGRHTYFDGCLRNEKQLTLTYRYVRDQAVRARLVRDWTQYPDTKVLCDLDAALRFAMDRKVFPSNLPYARYARKN